MQEDWERQRRIPFIATNFISLISETVRLLYVALLVETVMKTTALRRIFIITGSLRVQHVPRAHTWLRILAPAAGYRGGIIPYIFICNTM